MEALPLALIALESFRVIVLDESKRVLEDSTHLHLVMIETLDDGAKLLLLTGFFILGLRLGEKQFVIEEKGHVELLYVLTNSWLMF